MGEPASNMRTFCVMQTCFLSVVHMHVQGLHLTTSPQILITAVHHD